MRPALALLALLAVLAAGCGGDEDEPPPPAAPAPTGQATQPEPASTAPEREPEEGGRPGKGRRYERTPRSLAGCIRSAPGVEDVIVKGRDSEDATFFEDLVGGRVDVLGVTVRGQSAELGVFLFESAADAREAAPSAGGGGVAAEARGSAVVAAPPNADTAAIGRCLEAAGYG